MNGRLFSKKNLHLNRCFQDGFSPMGTSVKIIKRLKKIKKQE